MKTLLFWRADAPAPLSLEEGLGYLFFFLLNLLTLFDWVEMLSFSRSREMHRSLLPLRGVGGIHFLSLFCVSSTLMIILSKSMRSSREFQSVEFSSQESDWLKASKDMGKSWVSKASKSYLNGPIMRVIFAWENGCYKHVEARHPVIYVVKMIEWELLLLVF